MTGTGGKRGKIQLFIICKAMGVLGDQLYITASVGLFGFLTLNFLWLYTECLETKHLIEGTSECYKHTLV